MNAHVKPAQVAIGLAMGAVFGLAIPVAGFWACFFAGVIAWAGLSMGLLRRPSETWQIIATTTTILLAVQRATPAKFGEAELFGLSVALLMFIAWGISSGRRVRR